jgi:arylsulfatase A-like enzyme
MLMKNKIKLALPFLAVLSGVSLIADDDATKPNIIFIMADDLGKEWVSAYGSESIVTPRIDQLAQQGLKFHNAYATPQCTPTRVTLLTGQHPFRHGWVNHWDVPRWGNGVHFDINYNNSLALVMREAGYATAVAGKWQINDFRVEPDVMDRVGFDDWAMWTGGEANNLEASRHRYWNPYIHTREGSRTYEGEFGPDIFASFLIDFMRENADKPLFIYYPMVLPHVPFTTTPDHPDVVGDREQYKAMILYMDQLVGRFIDAVNEIDCARPTLIIFTSDNGSTEIESRILGRDVIGGKMQLTEKTGASVPFIAWAPGFVQEGAETYALLDFADMLPTFAELADGDIPAGEGLELDGKSFAAVLTGDESESQRDWILSMGGHPADFRNGRMVPLMPFSQRVIRDLQWKVWVNEQRKIDRLYHIASDPFEDRNLIDSNNPRVVAAKERFKAIVADMPETDAWPRYAPNPPQPWDRNPGWKDDLKPLSR